MAKGWQTLVETRRAHELSLAEGLEILLQSEEEQRNTKRFGRLVKNARFRYQASIEELLFDNSRGLDKSLITTLASGSYIDTGDSILVSGAAGCGKSFLLSSLGHQACAQGYSVAYFSTQKLLTRLKLARIDGTITKLFDKLAKTKLLILDDFGFTQLEGQQLLDMMEIIEDRHAKTSTIIASQLPVANWYDVLAGQELIADAILDRLVHSAFRINLSGESLRKKR